MEFDLMLKDISMEYLETIGNTAPQSGYKLLGFHKIWKKKTASGSNRVFGRTVAVAISVLAVAIIILTVGTMASQDWSDTIFGQLRRLFSSALDMDEFSVSEEEIASYVTEESGFKLLGMEYSTVPTLKEFLINGWTIESRGGVAGQENDNGTVEMYTSSYNLKNGDANIVVGISGVDAISEKKAKDCRVSYIKISKDIINLNNETKDSNLDSFMIDDINLLDINFDVLDNYFGQHISHNEITNKTENSDGFENVDTYIYVLNGTSYGHTGIFEVEYEVNLPEKECHKITVLFDTYFRD